MERVDILLATYNGEKFLCQQLDSILGQSHREISLLISDDASTDSTRKILREYAAKDDRITLFLQETNLGFVKNFEFLLTKSTAPYIAFSDQDDVWDANKVETMLSVLKTSGKSLAYCDMRRIDEAGEVISHSWFKSKSYPRVSGTSINGSAVRHFSAGCSQIFTDSVRRRMLPFKKDVFAHDWISVFCATELMGIIFIPSQLMSYRAHGGNVYGNAEDYAENLLRQSGGDKSYKGFLAYRRALIEQNHLRGAKMCRSYSALGGRIAGAISYLEKCAEGKYILPLLHKYFINMKPKGCKKRMFYELLYLHFPLIHYAVYRKTLKGRCK